MARISTTDDVPGGTPVNVSLKSTRELNTGTARTHRPVRATRPAPCNQVCPAGTDVRAALRHTADGDVEAAWRTILEHNPLPGICGRICSYPCERQCNRDAFDGAVAVHAVERAIADEARARRLRVERPAPSSQARQVAIIGAGPAGLSCAYHLAWRGHLPTIFDAMPEPGGKLRYGVPPFRLPREVLDAELETLWHLGVGFQGNARFGVSMTWEDLNSFSAVFVAVGAGRPRDPEVETSRVRGVRSALEFIRSVNDGDERALQGAVVVIGGGNTAMYAARTALRLGAAPVTVAYRRSREHMPAYAMEIEQAEADGVRFVFECAPLRFVNGEGRLTAIEFLKTRPGAADRTGRPRPEPVAGSIFRVEAAHAFTAVGAEVDVESFAPVIDVDRGRLYADLWGRTALPAVFAGGNAAAGTGMVVEAVGSGRRAAEAIDAWLAGREPIEEAHTPRVAASELNFFHCRPSARARETQLNGPAAAGMSEAVQGLDWTGAVHEARRCLSCGRCTECDTCLTFCPEGAVRYDARAGSYSVDLAHCKGCGICAEECPRGVVQFVAEAER